MPIPFKALQYDWFTSDYNRKWPEHKDKRKFTTPQAQGKTWGKRSWLWHSSLQVLVALKSYLPPYPYTPSQTLPQLQNLYSAFPGQLTNLIDQIPLAVSTDA